MAETGTTSPGAADEGSQPRGAQPYNLPVMGDVRVEDDVAEYLFTKYGIVQ